MKLKTLIIALVCFPVLLSAASIDVELVEPKTFRDFSVSGMSPERTAPLFEREVKRDLKLRVERFLGAHTLVLRFTDIDMAGDIQPWRNRNHQDIRYVESIYPPRLDFEYEVRDQDGTVILEGSERLRDLGFMYRLRSPRASDTFFYETELLRDWVRRDLAAELEDVRAVENR